MYPYEYLGVALLFIVTLTGAVSATADAKSLISCKQLAKCTPTSLSDVELANKVKLCLELQIDSTDKRQLETIKSKLSLSLRNAVFSKDVCIFNTNFNEYLYPPVSGFRYEDDQDKRRLFTWIPGNWDHFGKGDWKIIPSGKYFNIVSANHNEYLFAGGSELVEDKRRRVFTWDPEGDDFNQNLALWELETVGDDVFIKNKQYNEYLYAIYDGLNYDSQRRSVATWNDTTGCEADKKCIWRIESC